jgi:hypothetical protein
VTPLERTGPAFIDIAHAQVSYRTRVHLESVEPQPFWCQTCFQRIDP